jgi:acetyl-CoA acetyltransferase
MEGFTHLIPFAAGHEVIRQGRRDLTLVRSWELGAGSWELGAGCWGLAAICIGVGQGLAVVLEA